MTAPYRAILLDRRLLAVHDEPSAQNRSLAKVVEAIRLLKEFVNAPEETAN